MDDCLLSSPDEASVICLVKDLSERLRLGGFRLTKLVTNNRQ